MTREQFETLKVGDKVYTVKDKGFDQGDGMCEVSFAWNEGEIWLPTGVMESPSKTFPRVNEERIKDKAE